MADIVNSLFGLPPEDIRQQLYNEQQNFSTQFANTYGNEYDKRNALLGGMVGNALANVGAGVFGVQDPRLKRATTLESILQQTQQELGQGANDPSVLYPALQQRLAEAGFAKEAMQVGQVGQKAMQDAGLNRAKIMSEQAQQQKLQQEAAIKQQEVAREDQLRSSLAELPVNASDEEYLNVVRRFAPAKDVMSVIEKKQLAAEARQARTQDLQMKLEADTQRAQERNSTLIEQARIQGANAATIAKMRLDGQAELQQMKSDSARQLAEFKASSTALNTGAPKDVAEASSILAGIDYSINEIKPYQDMLENKKVIFSPKENAIAIGSKAVGSPTTNALAQDEVKRQVRSGVNQVLVAAKGTQTEGDAKRAYDLFIDAEGKNSTDSWKAALKVLVNTQTKLKKDFTRGCM